MADKELEVKARRLLQMCTPLNLDPAPNPTIDCTNGSNRATTIQEDAQVDEEGYYRTCEGYYTDICYDEGVDIYADYPSPVSDATSFTQIRLASTADQTASTGAPIAPAPANAQVDLVAFASGEATAPPPPHDSIMSSETPAQTANLVRTEDNTTTASADTPDSQFLVEMGVRASEEVIAGDGQDPRIAPSQQLSDPPTSTGKFLHTLASVAMFNLQL